MTSPPLGEVQEQEAPPTIFSDVFLPIKLPPNTSIADVSPKMGRCPEENDSYNGRIINNMTL